MSEVRVNREQFKDGSLGIEPTNPGWVERVIESKVGL